MVKSGGLIKTTESVKNGEIAPYATFLPVCGGVLVVVRKGCGLIGGAVLKIFNIE